MNRAAGIFIIVGVGMKCFAAGRCSFLSTVPTSLWLGNSLFIPALLGFPGIASVMASPSSLQFSSSCFVAFLRVVSHYVKRFSLQAFSAWDQKDTICCLLLKGSVKCL